MQNKQEEKKLLIVFFQPLQFFADLDVAVPGVDGEAVAFAGEGEEGVGDVERLEGAFDGYAFEVTYADIGPAMNQ
jgi:hypothetical protein